MNNLEMRQRSILWQRLSSCLEDSFAGRDLAEGTAIAVAVSGGPDSLALSLAAGDWARANGLLLHALTVDHGLRAEAGEEARQVARWLFSHDIPHHILRWDGPKPQSGVQAAASRARHALMCDWCAENEVKYLLTAHHRDDQAETVLFRLQRESGPRGLAGILPVLDRDDIAVLRPLLGLPKSVLVGALREIGQEWVEDPSNQDPKFARTTLRRHLAQAEALGTQLVDLAAKAQGLYGLWDRVIAGLEPWLYHPAGYAWRDAEAFRSLPLACQVELLTAAILRVGGGPYPPTPAAVTRLAGLGRGGSLGNCLVIFREKDAKLLVLREGRNLAAPAALRVPGLTRWDRFRIKVAGPGPADLAVGFLGEEGERSIHQKLGDEMLAVLPRQMRALTPTIRSAGKILAVPALDYWPGMPRNGVKVEFLPGIAQNSANLCRK